MAWMARSEHLRQRDISQRVGGFGVNRLKEVFVGTRKKPIHYTCVV